MVRVLALAVLLFGPQTYAHKKEHEVAHRIAKETLESNIVTLASGSYVRAGGTHFGSLWTRDFAWAVGGLLEIDRADVARNHLSALLSAMGRGGLIPRVLDSTPSWARVFIGMLTHKARPLRDPLKPEYRGEHNTIAIDSNLLVMRASLQYIRATGDLNFWQEHLLRWPELMNFYSPYRWQGWIVQEAYGDWQDSVKREGVSFLTNYLYWEVRQDLIELLGPERVRAMFGFTVDEQDQLLQRLWDTFYSERAGLFRSHLNTGELVSLDGNLLVLLRDDFFPTEADRLHLYRNLKRSNLWSGQPLPGRASTPEYPRRWRSFNTRVVGLHHYHDTMVWTWLTGLSLKVAATMNDKVEVERILKELAPRLERDGGVTEIWVVDEELSPFRSRLYRSENPFSWGAGLILEGMGAARRL
jgi:hypothetical protein